MSVLVRSPGRCMAPADALVLLEQLQESVGAGDDTDLAYALNTVRYAVARNIPVAPRFSKGRNGPTYDAYYCQRCGSQVNHVGGRYCWNCGQRLSDAYLGRRKTSQEQREHMTAATLRAMNDLEQSFAAERTESEAVKLEDFFMEGSV